jgi:hypothetical protein
MVRLKHHEGLPRITLEEIRSQAQKCIDESRKTQANPKLSAAWLALAEEWVNAADRRERAPLRSGRYASKQRRRDRLHDREGQTNDRHAGRSYLRSISALSCRRAATDDDGSAGSKTGRPEEEAVTTETIPAESHGRDLNCT